MKRKTGSKINFFYLLLILCSIQGVRGEEVFQKRNEQNKIISSIGSKIRVLKNILFPARSIENKKESVNKDSIAVEITPVFREITTPSLLDDNNFQIIDAKGKSFMMGHSRGDIQYRDEDIYELDSNESELYEVRAMVSFSYSFAMMKTEVTQAHWFEFTGENPSYFKEGKFCKDSYTIISSEHKELELCPHHPVERVSWQMIQDFIKNLNVQQGITGCDNAPQYAVGCYRLPTEAEWEYAVRGGNLKLYSFGDDHRDMNFYGWYQLNANNQTHAVGLKRENPYGLYDMYGNVWEWVLDKYNKDLLGGENPLANSGYSQVVRGGSWVFSSRILVSGYRFYYMPTIRKFDVGFRLVKTL